MSSPSRIPLLQALAELRRARTPGTVAMYATLAVLLVLVASVPVCGAVQGQHARAHHARPSSPATWLVFQVTPKMYSFAHRVWLTPGPLAADTLPTHSPVWTNHYPARTLRFETARAAFVDAGTDVNVLVRSAYQGRRWTSRFVVRVEHGELVITEATP